MESKNNITIVLSLLAFHCAALFPMIIVETNDGHHIEIPQDIAVESSIIKNLLKDEQTTIAHNLALEHHIDLPLPTIMPLPEVSKAELEPIIQILLALKQMDQETIKRTDGAYIAKRIQPIIDRVLAPITEPQLGAIIRAAEYLDLGYIVNGAIRVLTQKAFTANRHIKLKNIMAYLYSQRGKIKKPHYQPAGLITTLKPLFETQFALITTDRYRGAIPELSIADYIEISGMPKIKNKELDLSKKNITSLNGLDKIKGISQITSLALSLNYISFLPVDAFKAVPNLRVLHLTNNLISTLPKNIFSHTPHLQNLYLSTNILTQLPKHIFQPITNLQELLLNSNALTTLPEGIFNNLRNLKKLALDANNFAYIVDKNSYPFPKNTFHDLVSLRELYILNNPFSRYINKHSFMVRYGIPNNIHII